MKGYFLRRSFPESCIDTGTKGALDSFMNLRQKPTHETIPLILTYDPSLDNRTSILQENIEWVKHDEMGKLLVRDYKPMVTYRRPRNLKDIL